MGTIINYCNVEDDEQSSAISNCIFEIKEGEDNNLFTSFNGGKSFVVKLNGYAIIPLCKYNELNNKNKTLLKSIKKFFKNLVTI